MLNLVNALEIDGRLEGCEAIRSCTCTRRETVSVMIGVCMQPLARCVVFEMHNEPVRKLYFTSASLHL